MPGDGTQGRFSAYPEAAGPSPQPPVGKKKKKKDQASRLTRYHELEAELLARRSLMSPQGFKGDINPWNKS